MMANHLALAIKQAIDGDVYFDEFSRARYATDASIYQMIPDGVVVPKTVDDVCNVLKIAGDKGFNVLPRGAGTSQCGQTVNQAVVLDNTVHLNRILELDVENQRVVVQPGIVLDELNRQLKPHGLWFPVDVSTASRATIGGMTANNSCGGRSIRYGMMRDNVLSIDALLANGSSTRFSTADAAQPENQLPEELLQRLLTLGRDDQDEIREKFPDVLRRVGGYNLDVLVPDLTKNDSEPSVPQNLAPLLVGSEGTLAYFTAIELKLAPLMTSKVMGVCHFPDFYSAMDSAQHLVQLGPSAVELVDDTMIELARKIPMFNATLQEFVRDQPAALLLVEFSEATHQDNLIKLDELEDRVDQLGFSWTGIGANWGGVLRAEDDALQNRIAEVRKSGLNIMMSMKSAGKPISFVEDCAVQLPDLADYTAGLNDIFKKYGTKGTWYAHASVGCLHVRPVLNLKLDSDLKAMRSIAEETFALVKAYRGSHSGEHGDGIVRSEFHRTMFGDRMVELFNDLKRMFDPEDRFNPGKIVNPPKMDDRSLLRFHQDYRVTEIKPALDWSAWEGAGGGLQGAVEMCNNNGACRKHHSGVMCPSFRVTRDEKDLTRGRANVLRLALSGQLGDDALTSDDMLESMKLCVSCKGCKRECPTGVDMAKMKIEVLHQRQQKYGLRFQDRLIAELPKYAKYASRAAGLLNLRNRSPMLARLLERVTGFDSSRELPNWNRAPFRDDECQKGNPSTDRQVALFVDTFTRYFEPDIPRAAVRVLHALGFSVIIAESQERDDALCCGRTYLSTGLIEKARVEAGHLVAAVLHYRRKGIPVIGLEPSCLLTIRDEAQSLSLDLDTEGAAEHALMLEEFLVKHVDLSVFESLLTPDDTVVHLHGHCHQKAMNVMPSVLQVLDKIPGIETQMIESSCCGMAGSFGYMADTSTYSRAMGELSLFPAIRDASEEALVVADGTSCRHQISLETSRQAIHIATLLDQRLSAV